MKSWLRPVLFFPALALALAFAPVRTVMAQPAAASTDAPKISPADAASPPPAATPAPAAPTQSPADLSPPQSLEEAARAATEELRARTDELRRRNEESKMRARARVDQERARQRERAASRTGNAAVNVFGDASLAAGERADSVVAVFGSATSEGEVADAVVAVFGHARASGPVGEGVVSVFGNTTVTGRVGEAVVSVFGNATVNSHVGRVVVVFGNLTLGPKAEVDDEVVCVMGNVERDPAAVVHQQITGIGRNFGFSSSMVAWIQECLLKGRPLAFDWSVKWAWIVALSFFGFYLFLALLFPGSVGKCVQLLEARPGASVMAGVGSVVLTPVAYVLLTITVVGVLVVPFLAGGLFFAGLFGRAVMLAWIGRRLLKVVGAEAAHPALAVLLGGALVLAIYTVPVVGFITYKLLGWLGLGVVLLAFFSRSKRAPVAAAFPAGAASVASGGFSTAGYASVAGASAAAASGEATAELPPSRPAPPPVIPALALPRAGFWIRFGALAIDLILLGMVAALTTRANLAPFGIPVYAALMWKLKGTTVGGVVCNLKVVRVDGREVDWTTAIVRSLACFLSLAVFGFGFIWVAVDREKQSWHDKIAGTTVVRVPRGMSLA
jgi:uncharacterized RDD family membrane protein YckC